MSSNGVIPDMTTMHDPVHGPVSLSGLHGERFDTLVLLARTPELGRLRRIKQLGLASYAFPAADHSRFAHALGTAHVMRRLLEGAIERHLEKIDPTPLKEAFPGLSEPLSSEEAIKVVAAHLLIAALIQDVGELPYAHATWRLLRAGPDVKDEVADLTGTAGNFGGAKELFTAHFACSSELLAEDERVDIEFLLYLLFGDAARISNVEIPPDVASLRHLVDGVVDADRLDYVYRDAHHTFGHIGGPQAVVDSLGSLDPSGPVFLEPGPVLDFVSARSSVWSRVYFESQNRFRITLLRVILRAVRTNESLNEAFFGFDPEGGLSVEQWMRIDDAFVQIGLERLDGSSEHRHTLRQTEDGRRALEALKLYLEASAAYEAEWLPPAADGISAASNRKLPGGLYFDTCADYRHHRLYDRGSIRIAGRLFGRSDETVALEDCAGPLEGAFRVNWFPLALRQSVLLFLPASRSGASWKKFEREAAAGKMHSHLLRMDEEQRLAAPDTRSFDEYTGPAMFISYTFSDRDFVERILVALRARQRRYFLLESPLQGEGATPGENSVRAVEEAESVLVVLSENYAKRIAADLNGNLGKEMRAICQRFKSDGLPVEFISAEDCAVVSGAFPWAEVGLSEPPLVEPLRHADDLELARGVDRALSRIDNGGS